MRSGRGRARGSVPMEAGAAPPRVHGCCRPGTSPNPILGLSRRPPHVDTVSYSRHFQPRPLGRSVVCVCVGAAKRSNLHVRAALCGAQCLSRWPPSVASVEQKMLPVLLSLRKLEGFQEVWATNWRQRPVYIYIYIYLIIILYIIINYN